MIGSVFVFFIVLSILIIVHELGHFVVARKTGVMVEEFGFGLPPRLFGKKIGETIYSLNALPFGGFVRLHGETDEESITNPGRAFLNKSKKTRAAIVIAGVIMNVLLAIVSFAILYSFTGIPRNTKDVKVVEIAAGSPAQTAGLVVGDIVRKVDGKAISSSDEFIASVEQKKGKYVVLDVETNSATRKVTLIPRENPPAGQGPLGVTITSTEIYYPPVWQRPFYGIYFGLKDAIFWGQTVVVGLWKIVTGLFVGQVPKDVTGPVGIFAVTSQAAKVGILAVVNLVGILSINLAILNIVPFPALDGGRLLFIAIEKAIGRKVVPKVEAVIHTVGMVILLLLLLAITIHDVLGIIRAGSLSGFLNSVLK